MQTKIPNLHSLDSVIHFNRPPVGHIIMLNTDMFTTDLIREMGKLRGFALRLTNQPSDAEDLLQASLLKAIEEQDKFRLGSNTFAWCSKIMYNTFVSGYRRRKKHESQYDPEPIIAAQKSPESQLEQQWCREVNNAMQELNPNHQRILECVCVEGQQYQEVAAQLNIPVGTVRSRLSRARRELHKSLQARSTPEIDREQRSDH